MRVIEETIGSSPDSSRRVPVLEAKELYRFYHSQTEETFALRGVSLRVNAGEIVAVVGASGSGKSTLLNCLAGLDEPDGGSVLVAGKPMTRQSETERDKLRGEHIGVLLQSGNLIEHLSVLGNVKAAQSFVAKAQRRNPQQLLEAVGIEHRLTARPSTLSGGESARASLAVAMANSPSILLADEPTGEVYRQAEISLIELLIARAAEGVAVVVVTHSELLASSAHRTIELTDGRIRSA